METINHKEIADLLFPEIANGKEKDRKYFEVERNNLVAKRNLRDNSEVTRVGPSPTGPMHIGTLYMSLVSKKIAQQSEGVFYLRIEDTDKVREVEGSKKFIIETLEKYKLNFDEMYVQSERVDVYKAFAYDVVSRGLAYPCFMSSQELDKMREEQVAMKIRPGVYGKYATGRDSTLEDIKNKLSDNNGKYQVLRFKATGDIKNKTKFTDEFLGEHNIPENDEDFVLLKSDGVPTYHFAHVVDDYVLGTTFVTRGEEWLSSVGKHIALWRAIDVDAPKYGHIMPINKKIGDTIRKLSKRKDGEANIKYWEEIGYTREAIVSYLLRLTNPDLDVWWDEKVKNSTKINIDEYVLDLKQMKKSSRGPLLDMDKLNNMSADLLSQMSAEEVSEQFLIWAEQYDLELFEMIMKIKKVDTNYLEQILNIERETEIKRKDIFKWSDVRDQIFYFYDELFEAYKAENIFTDQQKDLLNYFSKRLEQENFKEFMQSLDGWIGKMKMMHAEYSLETKNDLKFSDFMMTLRKQITKKEKTPNLYYIFEVLGKESIIKRLKIA